MASQGSGPEVVENDRNEANKSNLNSSIPKNVPVKYALSPLSTDYPFVKCSLSELSYCYCVDESIKVNSEGSISRRKLKTSIEPFDFNTYKADMLSQLSTKQLLLNRKPTLIDNLISRNRSALLQNQMDGKRGSCNTGGSYDRPGRPGRPARNQQGGKERKKSITCGRPSTSLERNKGKELVTGQKRKRSKSIDIVGAPAIKRLRKNLKEEGGESSDGGGSSSSNTSRNTSLERSKKAVLYSEQTSSTDNTVVLKRKKKNVKKNNEHFRSSARFVARSLRSGKKRLDQNSLQQLDVKAVGRLPKKILKNAVKSKIALARKLNDGNAQLADKRIASVQKTSLQKKTPNITDSNSNLFIKDSGSSDSINPNCKQAEMLESSLEVVKIKRKRGRPRLIAVCKSDSSASQGVKDKLNSENLNSTASNSVDQQNKKDAVLNVIKKKRRKRDSMWFQKVKRYIKPKVDLKESVPLLKVEEDSISELLHYRQAEPPSLDSIVPPVAPEKECKPDQVGEIDTEMPVLQIEDFLLDEICIDKEIDSKITDQNTENVISNTELVKLVYGNDKQINQGELKRAKEDCAIKNDKDYLLSSVISNTFKEVSNSQSENGLYMNEVIENTNEDNFGQNMKENKKTDTNEATEKVDEDKDMGKLLPLSDTVTIENEEIVIVSSQESDLCVVTNKVPEFSEEEISVINVVNDLLNSIEENASMEVSSLTENKNPDSIICPEKNVKIGIKCCNELNDTFIPLTDQNEKIREDFSNMAQDSTKICAKLVDELSDNGTIPARNVEKGDLKEEASFRKVVIDITSPIIPDPLLEKDSISSPKIQSENSLETNFNNSEIIEDPAEAVDPKFKNFPTSDCINDVDSTCDNPSALDDPTSGDDSFGDISLYLPIEELEQFKENKESDNSCGSFANMSDIVTDSNQATDPIIVDALEENNKEFRSTEIEQTIEDLTEDPQEVNEPEPEIFTEIMKTKSDEDLSKDSEMQLKELFSDKNNSAPNELETEIPELGNDMSLTDNETVKEEIGMKESQVDSFLQEEAIHKTETENCEKALDEMEVSAECGKNAEETKSTVERQAMKEAVLQALGLKSLCPVTLVPGATEKPKRVQDSGYTGTLKAVIKLNRGGDKKSRTMVYRRSDDNTNTSVDKLEYKMICSEVQDGENASTINEEGTSYLNISATKLLQTNGSKTSHQSDSPENEIINGSPSHGVEVSEADDKSGGKESNLVIPEKSSSFSIHPGKLCSDVCSYCFGKFGSLDTPCHVAQLKDKERQKKILENEPHLTVESCLCDACYRYVDRRANCPNSATRRTKARPKPPASSICCVTKCEELATHTVKKKWLLKLKKSITNKLDIDMEKPGSMYYPLCTQHHYWVDYFTVCGICRKRLNRNHLYSLGSETDRLNLMLAEDGIPARLSDKLFLCKLCRYYSNLRLKYSDPSIIPAANQPFYKSYRKKILVSLDVHVNDSKGEMQAIDKRKKKFQDNIKSMKGNGVDSKSGAGEAGDLGDEMALRGLATLLGDQPVEQQTRIQVKFGNVNIGTLSNLNIGQHGRGSDDRSPRRYMSGGGSGGESSHLPLSAHLDFQGPSPPDGSWERCISTIQFDKRTKKLWQELQRPYGSQSSFLRHLVMLEKYWRSGYLVLSDGADPKAAKYVNSVLNRLKAFEGAGVHSEAKASPSEVNVSTSNSSTSTAHKPDDILKIPSVVKHYQEDYSTINPNDSFSPLINTGEIELTSVGPEKLVVNCNPYQSLPSTVPRTSMSTQPVKAGGSVSVLKREISSGITNSQALRVLEIGNPRQQLQQKDSVGMKKAPISINQTSLNRAKSLVKMVPPTSVNHIQSPPNVSSRCLPKSQQVRIHQFPQVSVPGTDSLAGRFVTVATPQGHIVTSRPSPGAPPPLLKIAHPGTQLSTVPSYVLSLASAPSQLSHNTQGVRLLVPQGVAPTLPSPVHSSEIVNVIPRCHPFSSPQHNKSPLSQPFQSTSILNSAAYSKTKPLKPILPKLPKALTVTQVTATAGVSGPAITLHGSGITIEKQSGNSPVTTAILPPEKPSISVFREPMPTLD